MQLKASGSIKNLIASIFTNIFRFLSILFTKSAKTLARAAATLGRTAPLGRVALGMTSTMTMAQAKEVESVPTEKQREELAKAYGIKGIPLLSTLRSLKFPQSFLYDFMHLIWENLILNLVLFWSGRYKGMDEGEPYVLSLHIWQAVGTTSAAATKTIPLSFGTSIPNPATDFSSFTSSTWSVWCLFIAPTVLQGRFPNDHYYKHFCSLVGLLNLCLQFEISEKDINKIELGICEWVVDYEQYICPFCF